MKLVRALSILTACNVLLSGCEQRDYTKKAEVKSEIVAFQQEGWEFVKMVGEAHGIPDSRSVRRSNAAGSLTVYAMNTGVDGHGSRQQDWEETFKEAGFKFLEVKVGTSIADTYSLVFRKPGGHPLDAMLAHGKHPFPADIEALLKQIFEIDPRFPDGRDAVEQLTLNQGFFDWEERKNLDEGRQFLQGILKDLRREKR